MVEQAKTDWIQPSSWPEADLAWEAGVIEFSTSPEAGLPWTPHAGRPSASSDVRTLDQFRYSPSTLTAPLGLFLGPFTDGRRSYFGSASRAAELGFEARVNADPDSMSLFTDASLIDGTTWVQCRPRPVEVVDPEVAALEDVIGHCYLHMDSEFVRRKMTSEERVLFDRSVKRWSDRLEADDLPDGPTPTAGPIPEPPTESPSPPDGPSLREMQRTIASFASANWPGLTVEIEGLALTEEVGEVARAIVKRSLANRGAYEDWTAELRREVGDAVIVLCNIASLEGFDLGEAVAERLAVVLSRDIHHDPVQATAPPTK